MEVANTVEQCSRTCFLVCKLWTAEEEGSLKVPRLDLYLPDAVERVFEDMISTIVLNLLMSSNDSYEADNRCMILLEFLPSYVYSC